jgi:hypothetical protein
MNHIFTKIEQHKAIAAHLEEAANRHREAAKHHEAGDEDEATNHAAQAYHHTALASEAQTEMLKHYSFTS